MNHRRRAAGAIIAAGLLALPLSCSRKAKPNANRDMRRDQQRLLNDMDTIAADLEKEKQSPPGPAPESAPPAPPPAGEKPNTDPPPKDGGGR